MSDNDTVHRRTVLERTGAALALTATIGTATAADGDQWYVVVTDGDASRRVARKGFDVRTELADGDVLLVRGPDGKTGRLASTSRVAAASVDVTADVGPEGELVGPESTADATDGDAGAGATAASSTVAPETTDEPYYDSQWDKALIDLPEAHETTTGEGARIALLDSGIYADHPDLDVHADLSRVVTRESIEDRGVRDVEGHGTHVAGIAAASIDNDAGVAGVAPDAELVSIRDVYEAPEADRQRGSSLARRLVGLEYAASIDVDVVSSTAVPAGLVRSFPPEARGSALADACRRLIQHAVDSGTVVVQAAGNYAVPSEGGANFQAGGDFMYPGFVPAALTVGATGPNDERAYYSHYGLSYLDVAAPGGGYETATKSFESTDVAYPYPSNGIVSTLKPGSPFAERAGFPDSLYGPMFGTSMATPQVAGTAALVRSIAPDVDPYRVMQAIQQGADGERGPDVGAGRLNAAAALDASVLNGARQ
ncbi:Serine protease, subtilisin family [Halomicrobium zhouii]|uniref:Serine protease, subtilisin family n=1 Tax=Halomicrobium zhouii TaxID=767519 RepID=A0A1I6KNJ4_9EURY|nr:S8 family serine peptidase [Halomicrobium zhouii]SFR92819.1 Serine protease, subtilisin family [Halomicrobium zhouii]